MYKHVSGIFHLLLLVLLLILLGTCASTVYSVNHEPGLTPAGIFIPTPALTLVRTPVPSVLPTSRSVLPTFDTVPETGWTSLGPGLEKRVFPIYNSQGEQVESLHIWRLDQNYFRMEVAFDERPKSLESWQRETNALMVVNGGYYSIENERYFPDGLTVLDGAASGRSFGNRSAGMLAIQENRAELRWLVERPYDPSERLQAALQSFPILVRPGGGLGIGAERESHARARRTVLAQDRNGRILFLVAPQGYFTLHQLSAYLTESDLNLDIAVNLDGGGSTGILVADPHEIIPPTRPLPFVILVYDR